MAKKRKKGFKRKGLKEIRPDKEYREVYNETVGLQREANKRLTDIYKLFGKGTWSAPRSLEKQLTVAGLDAWSYTDKVLVSKSYSKTQLKAIRKALKNFLSSKTGSVKGIKQAIRKSKETIAESISDEDIDIDVEDIESIYDLMSDETFRNMTQYIEPSELNTIMIEARNTNMKRKYFITMIEDYKAYGEDEDLKKNTIKFYNKYVKAR